MLKKQIIVFVFVVALLVGTISQTQAAWQRNKTNGQIAYLPLVTNSFSCATTSSQIYTSGIVRQFDQDDPVRPAYNHADKNINLRGYTANTDSNLQKELVTYNSNEETQPPQFATFFSPNKVPALSDFYQVYNWIWSPSPEPGSRGDVATFYAVTALGFSLDPGETLHVPTSGFDIGGGMEVVVLYADEDTIALHYTREDTAAVGYTIHVDQICVDPNLLALYNSLDASNGPRYTYSPGSQYELPNLAEGQQFGTASASSMVIAIADVGSFQDPRSCTDWWQIRPGYSGDCPAQSRTANSE